MQSQTTEFFSYLEEWQSGLKPLSFTDFIEEAGGARHVAVFCVDLIKGFCTEGPLQSARVRNIIPPIVKLFHAAHDAGVRHFIMPQDAHHPDAAEFADFPPHCVRGTSEAQTVPEILDLHFGTQLHIIPKNTVHSAYGTMLNEWLEAHPQITHRIVVGDCTDLCAYHLALHLKYRDNAENRHHPVVVPADCVATYDVPVAVARETNTPAHPTDVFHPIFLYSLALNGVRIVQTLT